MPRRCHRFAECGGVINRQRFHRIARHRPHHRDVIARQRQIGQHRIVGKPLPRNIAVVPLGGEIGHHADALVILYRGGDAGPFANLRTAAIGGDQ